MLTAVLLWTQSALAAYQQFHVFGDSLSDSGNAFALSGGIFPPTPSQRFTNGPTTADVIAANLGITGFGPSEAGGTNYAVGGATTGTANFNHAVSSPFPLPAALATSGMTAQVGQFLSSTAFDPATTLFMVWGGPNDVFLGDGLGEDLVNVTLPGAIANLANIVGALALAGAQDVLVPLMGDLGATPFGLSFGQQGSAQLTQLTQGFNAGLLGAMSQVEQITGINVILVDTFSVLDRVLDDPSGFGFTNVTDPCTSDPLALASNCAGYLFFDGVHPTAAGHAILGNVITDAVVDEPPMLMAMLLALSMAMIARRGQVFER